MAYVIYLTCCAMNSVLMNSLGVSMSQWEYWISLALIIASWIGGREYEDKRKK